jgi:hypothetical protein
MGCPWSSSSIARLMRLGFGACAIVTPTAKTREREVAMHHRSVFGALIMELLKAAISCQLSAVSYQLSAVSFQLSNALKPVAEG